MTRRSSFATRRPLRFVIRREVMVLLLSSGAVVLALSRLLTDGRFVVTDRVDRDVQDVDDLALQPLQLLQRVAVSETDVLIERSVRRCDEDRDLFVRAAHG